MQCFHLIIVLAACCKNNKLLDKKEIRKNKEFYISDRAFSNFGHTTASIKNLNSISSAQEYPVNLYKSRMSLNVGNTCVNLVI